MVGVLPILMMGIAVAFNLIIIKMKIERYRYEDASLDSAILVLLGWLFSGSIAGLMIGTIASAFISIYLFISPPDELMKRFIDKQKNSKKKNKKNKNKKSKRKIYKTTIFD